MKIEDLAALAGVSRGAVSLALNNKPGVSEETRKKIIDLARENNYVPRRRKKNIKKVNSSPQKRETLVIHFVACQSESIITRNYQTQPFFDELITSFLAEVRNNTGVSLVITSIDTNNLIEELIKLSDDRQVDGVILLGTNLTTNHLDQLSRLSLPMIIIDTYSHEHNLSFVSINNYQGGFEAGKQILDRGHSCIGYAKSNTRIYNFDKRQQGFLDVLKKNHLSIANDNIYTFSPTEIAVNPNFQRKHFIKTEQPTAIFCENDYIAISLTKTLSTLGIRVPEDIAVVGFDNIKESSIVSPELSTIDVSKQLLAHTALNQVLNLIENPTEHIQSFIGTHFVKRQSF
ncbi:LacI family DNA-binding transcriptional regulator [Streptococcus pasteurianus]|uniref:LacI family DNA-binding transcriptional regulator n=1 Tax=Streptococcus pasteurianus TaxID=197614 RepID=UPI003013C5C1